MKNLFDFQGRSVRLTLERWMHITQHAEMVGMDDAVLDTLVEPELVVRSLTDEAAFLHYRRYLKTMVGDKWLCVVVKYSGEDAFVLTAYLTDKPKQGEEIWRKP